MEINPILAQCSISVPPENISLPLIFGHFHCVWSWNIEFVKWVNSLQSFHRLPTRKFHGGKTDRFLVELQFNELFT